jgi:hypothetical protein
MIPFLENKDNHDLRNKPIALRINDKLAEIRKKFFKFARNYAIVSPNKQPNHRFDVAMEEIEAPTNKQLYGRQPFRLPSGNPIQERRERTVERSRNQIRHKRIQKQIVQVDRPFGIL